MNNYYPFGLNHISGMLSISGFGGYYSYKYNGKELQENGMYDYGARMYMPGLGRWDVMDAMSEKYRRHSPYNYAVNNPVMVIDPDGNDVVSVNGGMMATGGDAGFAYSAYVATMSTSSETSGNYFTQLNFDQFMNGDDDDPPGNKFSRFRMRTANWVQENIRGPLSGWFDTHTRNAFVLDAEGQARMDDLRGQMSSYMRSNVGGGIRWGAEHGLIGSGMGTGNIGAFRKLDPNRLPFKPFAEMSEIEIKGFQHAISRHRSEFGLKWKKSSAPQLVEEFNTLASQIRKEGGFAGYERVLYGERGSGKSNTLVKARTFELVKNKKTYYYYETLGGRFIIAGLKTK
ncbi:RHS repeat-associated core domain-containing protein [Chryseobacterium culicis]|uniref:RHS repeat-associated core domain-containing protein n=1 Tax=Chryseobacterium culicis TaxID=680127 RepID=UPI001D0BE9BB|nr:RHS repeat-associated core domain-containing protein [Chryseobacterium culicis]